MDPNKKGILIKAIFILMILMISFSYGQNQGTSSIQFLKIIPSAKIMSMGESGVSIQDNAESVFLNPAGLTQVQNIDVRFSTVDWFLDTRINAISAAYNFGTIGSFGLNLINANYGEFEETRVDMLGFIGDEYNPGLTGRTFNAGVTLVGLSYARALTDRFSFGLTANYIWEDLYLEKMETTLFNLGFHYDSMIKSLKLGIALKNLGPKVVYVKEKNTIPQVMTVGISGYLISNNDNLFMNSENHQVNFVVDLLKPRDDSQKFHIGLDYRIYDLIDLRAGYKLNYDTEGLTLGLGFAFKFISVDYSYNDLGDYWEAANRVTIGITL